MRLYKRQSRIKAPNWRQPEAVWVWVSSHCLKRVVSSCSMAIWRDGPATLAPPTAKGTTSFPLRPGLDAGRSVYVDVDAVAYFCDGHDSLRIRPEDRGPWFVTRDPLFCFPFLRVLCVLGGSIIVRMG